MATHQDILEILNRLGNAQQNGNLSDLERLAREIKQKQIETKIAVAACTEIIQRLSNSVIRMEPLLEAARQAETRENAYLAEMKRVLEESPNKQEIDDVIQNLRTTVNALTEQDANITEGLSPDQKQVLGISESQPPPPPGAATSGAPAFNEMLRGGYDWRTNSKKKTPKSKSKRKTKSRRTSKKGGKNRNRVTRGRGRGY